MAAGLAASALARTVAGFALGALMLAPVASGAQERETLIRDTLAALDRNAAPPWIGERLRYKIKYGIFGVGEGSIAVPGLDTIDGRTTYAAEMSIKGGIPGARIDQRIYSWIDTEGLFSRRFVKDEEDRPREYDFHAEERLVHQIQNKDTTWTIPTAEPLDDLSLVFLTRALPLEVGRIYTFNRYFKEENNPIILKVLRRDRREVGAGEFNTIVVQPIIPESDLYSEGGNAEIHLSDDERRLIVYMKVDLYLLNLTLHLEEFQEGAALGGEADAQERKGGEGGSGRPAAQDPPGGPWPRPPEHRERRVAGPAGPRAARRRRPDPAS